MSRRLNPFPTDWLVDAVFRGLIGLARRLPYERRVVAGGWVFAHVIAPLAGYRRRIRANLGLIFPDMPQAEVRRLCRAVPDHVGRNLIELYSPEQFLPRARATPLSGPGVEAVLAARKAGRPVFVVSGHFGNFNALRAALDAQGVLTAALYRPMNNRFFNRHYVAALNAVGTPVFPRSRPGMADFMKRLRAGEAVAMLLDLRMAHGRPLRFFGRTAWTALSAAEMALKFDALLVPAYAVRQPNGLDFEITVEAPIPRDAPEAMTQALNDSLEAMVRRHMDQWFWIHRRWATPRVHEHVGDAHTRHAGG